MPRDKAQDLTFFFWSDFGTQSSDSRLAENTVPVLYKEKSIYAVRKITGIYRETYETKM
jgi:hypothetical protein